MVIEIADFWVGVFCGIIMTLIIPIVIGLILMPEKEEPFPGLEKK